MMILTLVHEWKNVAYLFEELIRILFKEHLCVAPPINVAHNVAFFFIGNAKMKKLDTLVQYLFKDEEHEVENLLPHGNSKKNLYRCTRLALEASVDSKEKTSKEILDNVYHSVGDVTEARSLGQLPRGPSNIFNARFGEKSSSRSHESEHQSKNVNELNVIWQLLEKAKREEKECDNSTSIREWRIHPDFLVVLASDCQLQDLEHFLYQFRGIQYSWCGSNVAHFPGKHQFDRDDIQKSQATPRCDKKVSSFYRSCSHAPMERL